MRTFRNLLFLMAFCATSYLYAQPNLTHPLVIDITSPSSIVETFQEGAYGYQSQWGPTSISVITGQVEWAFDITPDSLVCDSVPVGSLTGKIALIRRGGCAFSDKVENAEAAGAVACIICNSLNSNPDPNAIINMSATGATATIPAIFLSTNSCAAMAAAVDAGDSVSVTFRKPSIVWENVYDAYQVPLDYVKTSDPVSSFIVTNINSSTQDVNSEYIITRPNGTDTVLNFTSTGLAADATDTIDVLYTPTDTGLYALRITTNIDADTSGGNFYISENAFSTANSSALVGVGPDSTSHASAGFRHDATGSFLFVTGDTFSVATVQFGLDNPEELVGESIFIYVTEVTGTLAATSDWTQNTAPFNLIAVGSVVVSAADSAAGGPIIYSAPVQPISGGTETVLDGGADFREFFVVASHTGTSTDIIPNYLYDNVSQSYYYSSGWIWTGDGTNGRLYGGFGGAGEAYMQINRVADTNTSVDQVEQLDASAVSVFPNPVNDQVNVELSLDKLSSNVDITLIDMRGSVLQTLSFSDVQNEVYQINTSELPAGSYLLNIRTDEGQSFQKFVKK